MYIRTCRAHFCHLPHCRSGQVGHSPRETSGSAETLNWGPMWLGSQSTCEPPTPTLPAGLNAPNVPYTPAGPNVPWHPLPPAVPSEPLTPNPLLALSPYTPNVSYTPAGPQHPLPQEQGSSCQEWYYYRWAWHVISLWVRLLFCQMHPHPLIPPQCTQGEISGSQEWY